MKQDKFGNLVYQSQDIIELLYKNVLDIDKLLIEDTEHTRQFQEHSMLSLNFHKEVDGDVKSYDKYHQSTWFIPDSYKSFDIYNYCIEHCNNDREIERCMEELILYEDLDMVPVLTVLKYIVDTLRENKIVWGVGRGSSVSSYVLYKLGVHKIDSMKYELDYREFLRL